MPCPAAHDFPITPVTRRVVQLREHTLFRQSGHRSAFRQLVSEAVCCFADLQKFHDWRLASSDGLQKVEESISSDRFQADNRDRQPISKKPANKRWPDGSSHPCEFIKGPSLGLAIQSPRT